MSKSKNIHSGFTLIELCIVLAILSILAAIAALNYSKHRDDEYDEEALADIHVIYQQASQALSDWSLGDTADAFHIPNDCAGFTIRADKWTPGVIQSENDNSAGWEVRELQLPSGLHHWRYNVCYGTVEITNGAENINVPSFIISASRFTGNEVNGVNEIRYILHGSGIDNPIIGLTFPAGDEDNIELPAGLILSHPEIVHFGDID